MKSLSERESGRAGDLNPSITQSPAHSILPTQYFFSSPENVARLQAVLLSWLGTPFHKYSMAKGKTGGSDCIGFLQGVVVEVGMVEPFEFPRSAGDYSRHRVGENLNRILDYLRGKIEDDPQSARLAARFEELKLTTADYADKRGLREKEDPSGGTSVISAKSAVQTLRLPNQMPGDVLVYKDHSVFHLPIVFNRRKFFHCMWPLGVTEGNMDDSTFAPYLVAAFRARQL